MALNSLHCAEVPLRNCSLTHSLTHLTFISIIRLLCLSVYGCDYQRCSLTTDSAADLWSVKIIASDILRAYSHHQSTYFTAGTAANDQSDVTC